MLRSTLTLAAGLALAGCAAMKYEPVPYDSVQPVAMPRACRGAALAGDAACTALVRADQWYSDTGLDVQPGERYCIRIPPGQRWFDAARINIPPFGEDGSALMNIYSKQRRDPDARWFSLIAAVVRKDEAGKKPLGDEREQLQRASLDRPSDCHPALGGRQFVANAAGALVLYPNDAIAATSYDRKHFYRNNSGQVWVTITRLYPQ